MLEIFRKNLFLNSLAILLYTIVLHLRPIIDPIPFPTPHADGVLSDLLYQVLPYSSLWLGLLQFALLFFQAVYINRICNVNRLSQPSNLFPGLFYILLMSLNGPFTHCNPMVLANSFLILALIDLMAQSKNADISLRTFNMGLSLAVASLFYMPLILLAIAFFIGLIVLRSVKLMDFYRFSLGIIIPYFLLWTILFLCNALSYWNVAHFGNPWQFTFAKSGVAGFTTLGLFIIAVVIIFSLYDRLGRGINVHIRRKVNVFWWYIAAATIVALIGPMPAAYQLQVLSLPLGLMMGLSLFVIENKTIAETVHILFVGAALLLQFLI